MSQATALVIDDDVNLGAAFKIALQLAGFEVDHLTDSTQAMAAIVERHPTLVTLDMQMPKVSGADILRQIRADERLNDVKVIIVTGYARAPEMRDIDELADVILIKPVTVEQIHKIASRFL